MFSHYVLSLFVFTVTHTIFYLPYYTGLSGVGLGAIPSLILGLDILDGGVNGMVLNVNKLKMYV